MEKQAVVHPTVTPDYEHVLQKNASADVAVDVDRLDNDLTKRLAVAATPPQPAKPTSVDS